MIDRSNGVDKGVARRAGLVSQYIRGWRGWGAGCLLYIKSPRVITKINRTGKKTVRKSGATSLKPVRRQRTKHRWQ
jgi:hypothetical protein